MDERWQRVNTHNVPWWSAQNSNINILHLWYKFPSQDRSTACYATLQMVSSLSQLEIWLVPGTGWTQAGDQFDQWRLSQPQLDNLLALASSWSRDFIKRNGSKGEGARSSSVTPSLVEKVTTGSSNPLLSSLGGNWASHPTLRALPTETTGCYENYTLWHSLQSCTFLNHLFTLRSSLLHCLFWRQPWHSVDAAASFTSTG